MSIYDCDDPDPMMRRAEQRLLSALSTPGLEKIVCEYFEPESSFAGLTFDFLGHNPPNEITPDDLLSATLLDKRWPPLAVRKLLSGQPAACAELLSRIDSGTTIWAPQAGQELSNADPLWKELTKLHGVGVTLTRKLLARKRPMLIPITDSIIRNAIGYPGKTWHTIRYCFEQESIRQAVESLRPPNAQDVSLLRIFDVAIWMLCSKSQDARKARERAGMPQDSCGCRRPEK